MTRSTSARRLVLTMGIIVLWLLALHGAAIFSFTTGFFLTRYEVKHFSDHDSIQRAPQFKRAVVLVIDALRFDFALHNFSAPELAATTFLNKLPILSETLRDHPDSSYLFRFVADPPTTTMQRLKGLTTGGMPTFIDAVDNFNSDAISEDSWVRQLSKAGKKVVFMGDDTWMSLFPDAFTRVYPFPSFNVKDLHTVDNGVIDNLVPEIKGRDGDWDVIIGHFLGVDHVGHRLGSDHPEMAAKLTQMNAALHDVIRAIDNDTVLLVFGDHGMTHDGNHGGSTDLEVDSALFAYAKRGLDSFPLHNKFSTPAKDITAVYQIDLVPTICSLMGVPIPFGNLGFVIPELVARQNRDALFSTTTKTDNNLDDLLRYGNEASRNAEQLMRYLKTYSETTRQFPPEDLNRVHALFESAAENYRTIRQNASALNRAQLVEAIQRFLKFHEEAIAICRRLWTTFDTVSMWCGLVAAFTAAGTALVAALSTLDQLHSVSLLVHTLTGATFGGVCGAIMLGLTRTRLPALLALMGIGSTVGFCIVSGLLTPILMKALQILHPSRFGTTPDSGEDSSSPNSSPPRTRAHPPPVAPYKAPVREYSWLYAIVALACLFMRAAGLWSNSYIEAEDDVSYFLLCTLTAVFAVSAFGPQSSTRMIQRIVVLTASLKASSYVTGGKHESFLSSSGDSVFSVLTQTFLPLMALPPVALSMSEIHESYVSKGSPKRSPYWIRMWLHVCVAAVLTFWTAQWLGWLEWSWVIRIALPQFVYIGSLIAFLLRFLFRSDERLDFIFGWIATIAFPPLALILGPPAPAALFVLFVAAHCILDMSAEIERKSSNSKSAFGFALAVFWQLLGTRWFYATGHAQQFNALQFSAPFVGFDKFDFITGALIMVFNTFASQWLCGFFVPFLAFWEGRPTLVPAAKVAAAAAESPYIRRHEDVVRRVPRPLETLARRTLFYLFLSSFFFLNTVGLTFMMKRHLMVWRVFAPKFVFEAASIIVSNIAVFLGLAVTWRHCPK